MSINMMPYNSGNNSYNNQIIRFETNKKKLTDKKIEYYYKDEDNNEIIGFSTNKKKLTDNKFGYIKDSDDKKGKKIVFIDAGKPGSLEINNIEPEHSLKMRKATPAEGNSLYRSLSPQDFNNHYNNSMYVIPHKLKKLADQHLSTLMFMHGKNDDGSPIKELKKDDKCFPHIIKFLIPNDTHLAEPYVEPLFKRLLKPISNYLFSPPSIINDPYSSSGLY